MQPLARELADSSGYLLARLGMRFKMQAVAAVEQAGYDAYHYSVLAMLDERDRETQVSIAAAIDLDPSRLVALLDGLQEKGLVARRRDPQDRRRYLVSITADGRREHRRLRRIIRKVEDEFLAPLDQDTRTIFHACLRQLAAHHDPRCGPGAAAGPAAG